MYLVGGLCAFFAIWVANGALGVAFTIWFLLWLVVTLIRLLP